MAKTKEWLQRAQSFIQRSRIDTKYAYNLRETAVYEELLYDDCEQERETDISDPAHRSLLIQTVCNLVPFLSSFSEYFRLCALQLLLETGYIFSVAGADSNETSLNRVELGKFDRSFSAKVASLLRNGSEVQTGIILLFDNIGNALGNLGGDLVSTLEAQYSHPDEVVRANAVLAVSCIIKNSYDLLNSEKVNAYIWKMYFMFESGSFSLRGSNGYNSMYISQCNNTAAVSSNFVNYATTTALTNLVPCYTAPDHPILFKQVLFKMLDCQTQIINASSTSSLECGGCLQNKFEKDLRHMITQILDRGRGDDIIAVLILQITTHQEHSYDFLIAILHYCLQYHSIAKQVESEGKEKSDDTVENVIEPYLIIFVDNLIKHLIAFEPITRQGALMCLSPILTECSAEIIQMRPNLLAYLINACMDDVDACASLAMLNIRHIASGMDEKELVRLIDNSALEGKNDFDVILLHATKLCKTVLPRELASIIINSLVHTSQSTLIKRLGLLSAWARTGGLVEEDIPTILNVILPILGWRGVSQDSDDKLLDQYTQDQAKLAVLSIIKRLINLGGENDNNSTGEGRMFSKIKSQSWDLNQIQTLSILSSMLGTLQFSQSETVVTEVLSTAALLPLHYVRCKSLSVFLDVLLKKCFEPNRSIRHKTYEALGACAIHWKKDYKFLLRAIGALVLSVSETSCDGLKTLLYSLTKLLKVAKLCETMPGKADLEPLISLLHDQNFIDGMACDSMFERIPHIDKLITLLHKGKKIILSTILETELLAISNISRYDAVLEIINPVRRIETDESDISGVHQTSADNLTERVNKKTEFIPELTINNFHFDTDLYNFNMSLVFALILGKLNPELNSDGKKLRSETNLGQAVDEEKSSDDSQDQTDYRIKAFYQENQKIVHEILWPILDSGIKNQRQAGCTVLLRCFIFPDKKWNKELLSKFLTNAFDLMILSLSEGEKDGHDQNLQMESVLFILESLLCLGINTNMIEIIVRCFAPNALERISDTGTSAAVRLQSINFVLAAILQANQELSNPLLEPLRNTLRDLFASPKDELLHATSKAYPVVAHLATKHIEVGATKPLSTNVPSVEKETKNTGDADGFRGNQDILNEYYSFLIADLEPMKVEDLRNIEDPKLQKLSPKQLKQIIVATIESLGALSCNLEIGRSIIDVLIGFLTHVDIDIRRSSLQSIINLNAFLPKEEQIPTAWIVLPLLGDNVPGVRYSLCAGVNGRKPFLNRLCEKTSISKGAMDEEVLFPASDELARKELEIYLGQFNSSSEEIPADTDFALLKPEVMRRWYYGDQFEDSLYFCDTDGDTYGWQVKPKIGPLLLSVVQKLVEKYCGELSPQHYGLVEYHIRLYMTEADHNPRIGASAAIVLSELARKIVQKYENYKNDEMEHILQQGKNMSQSLVLNISSESKLPLVRGCAIGIKNIASSSASIVIPMFVQSLCSTVHLSMCHFIGMEEVLLRFSDTVTETNEGRPKPARNLPHSGEIKGLITAAQAKQLVTKLLDSLKSESLPVDTKKAALSLIAEMALLSSSQDMSTVILSIVKLLEDNEDANIHELCQNQLSTIFSSLPSTHPLVNTVTNDALEGIQSPKPNDRQRSLTLLPIVMDLLTPSDTFCCIVRALADPDQKIRHRILKILINFPPNLIKASTSNGAKDFADEISLYIRSNIFEIDMEARNSKATTGATIDGKTSYSIADVPGAENRSFKNEKAHSEAMQTMMTLPLHDEDPDNLTFLRTNTRYRNQLSEYGFNYTSFLKKLLSTTEKNQSSEGNSFESTQPLNSTGARSDSILSEEELLLVSGMSLASVISYLTRIHSKENYMTEMFGSLETHLEQGVDLVESVTSNDFSDDDEESDTSIPDTMEETSKTISFDFLNHNVKIYLEILRAQDGINESIYQYLEKFQQLEDVCRETCVLLRKTIYEKMQEATILLSTSTQLNSHSFSIPIVSAAQYFMMEKYHQASKFKKRKDTDNNTYHDEMTRKRQIVEEELSNHSRMIWNISNLQSSLIRGLGDIYSNINTISGGNMISAFEWLMNQVFGDSHRGLRQLSGSAIISMAESNSAKEKAQFTHHIRLACARIKNTLVHDSENIENADNGFSEAKHEDFSKKTARYRGRVDVLFILGNLLRFNQSKELKDEIVPILIKLWDDDDGMVRSSAIKFIQTLDIDPKSPLRQLLADEIGIRLQDPDYLEKDSLSSLFQWVLNQNN